MANLWTFQIQISILVFVYCAEKSPVANRRYGVSLRTTPYNELLHEKAIKQEFMRKILAKLGMAKRPPLIPYDQRKPNIPRPVIDGGISTATKEDIENKIQIMIASEEENRDNCQDTKGCFSFKLNLSLLRKQKIQLAALHLHNEAQTSSKSVADRKTIAIIEINPSRKRRSSDVKLQEAYYKSHKNVHQLKNSNTKRGSSDAENTVKNDRFSNWSNKVDKVDTKKERRKNLDNTETQTSGAFQDIQDKEEERSHDTNNVKDALANDKVHMGRHREPRQVVENEKTKGSVKAGRHIRRKAYIPHSGWFHINADDIVNRWLRLQEGKGTIHMLQFSSHGLKISTKPRFRPFIVLDVTESKFRRGRKKRSYAATCVPGFNKCCLRQLHVKFKDIKWNDWIIQPDGYQVNYCEGRCTGTGTMSAYSHAFIKKEMLSRGIKKNLQICCIPLKFDKLPLLHYDEEGSIHKTVLEDMSVLECGCV